MLGCYIDMWTSGLDKELPVPLYHQLKNILMNAIVSGVWQPNQQLPTEEQLAGRYRVSKITVRQALRELSDLGYVRREQGRGTFVSKPRMSHGPRELTGFTEEMRRRHVAASSRVLLQCLTEADAALTEALKIPAGAPVLKLKRLRLANGEPMGIQTAYLPAGLVPGLVEVDLGSVSLYAALQNQYGLHAAYATESHFAVSVERAEAELLQVPPGSAGMAAERVTYLRDGRPLEVVHSLMRGDRYRIVLDLVEDPHSSAGVEEQTSV
jgi:GntR family transcriptional regulator